MKQTLHFISAIIIVISASCNSEEQKTTNSTEVDSVKKTLFTASRQDSSISRNFCRESGAGNFLISQADGEKMITHFKDIYTKDGKGNVLPGVTMKHWVDACTIHALDKLLYSNSEYDGVRVIFAALNDASKVCSFYLVPTKTDMSNTTIHTEDWVYTIDQTGCVSTQFFSTFQNAITGIKNFGSTYAEKPSDNGSPVRDSLSQKCWINKCVIRSLSSLLTNHSADLDGININLAAYDAINPLALGQKKPNQSTIVLVTSARDGHRNVWEISEFFIREKNLSAYNHSQLCPQNCL